MVELLDRQDDLKGYAVMFLIAYEKKYQVRMLPHIIVTFYFRKKIFLWFLKSIESFSCLISQQFLQHFRLVFPFLKLYNLCIIEFYVLPFFSSGHLEMETSSRNDSSFIFHAVLYKELFSTFYRF